jgi:hypothetical protein
MATNQKSVCLNVEFPPMCRALSAVIELNEGASVTEDMRAAGLIIVDDEERGRILEKYFPETPIIVFMPRCRAMKREGNITHAGTKDMVDLLFSHLKG